MKRLSLFNLAILVFASVPALADTSYRCRDNGSDMISIVSKGDTQIVVQTTNGPVTFEGDGDSSGLGDGNEPSIEVTSDVTADKLKVSPNVASERASGKISFNGRIYSCSK